MLDLIRESKLGLSLPKDLTCIQWLDIGHAFSRCDDALNWALGDWINFGQGRVAWGEKYKEALAATGREYSSLKNCAITARAIEMARRRAQLSFSHHVEVSPLANDEQDRWLSLAIKHKLSVRELRASIKAGKVVRLDELDAERDDAKGIYTPQAVRSIFDRTIRQVTERMSVEKWPSAMRDAWKRELKPIAEFYSKL